MTTSLTQKFADFRAQAARIGFSETRQDSDDYLEAVFLSAKLDAFSCALLAVFGQPVYPSETPIPAAVKAVIDARGGIMGKQTLYASVDGNELVFAMLWPWSDKEHITLKTGRVTV